MRTVLLHFLSFLAVLLATPWLAADTSVLIPEHTARAFGLKRAWFTQVEMDRSRARDANATQHISSSRKRTVFEDSYRGGKVRFNERHINRLGEPIGLARAEKLAKEKEHSLELAGLEPK